MSVSVCSRPTILTCSCCEIFSPCGEQLCSSVLSSTGGICCALVIYFSISNLFSCEIEQIMFWIDECVWPTDCKVESNLSCITCTVCIGLSTNRRITCCLPINVVYNWPDNCVWIPPCQLNSYSDVDCRHGNPYTQISAHMYGEFGVQAGTYKRCTCMQLHSNFLDGCTFYWPINISPVV